MPAQFVPHYRRVMDDIKTKIQSGEWPPNFKLPSTKELAAQYEIAPATVRDAVNRLIESGWLRGHQGVGVFVSERSP